MATVEDLVEYEQPRVDDAYHIGEGVLRKLRSPTQAVHDQAAHLLQRQRAARADHLEQLLQDDENLMVRGRVDFVEGSEHVDGGGRTFYIGLVHLSDHSGEDPQVVSWASDRAQAWRNPTGKQANGSVARTLVFDGAHRKLTSVDEARFRNGALEPGSIDPLLARLARTSSGAMTDVIATIQQGQFDLMSRDADSVMVVQGGPGTGKTIVGLHRVSVLLFQSEGELTESDVLVVGPSRVFLDYVKGLLPSLGRTHVHQVEIATVGRPSEIRLTGSDSTAARRVKGLPVMAEVLRRFLDLRFGEEVDGVAFDGGGSLSAATIRAIVDEQRSKSTLSYNDLREQVRTLLLQAVAGRGEEEQREFQRRNRRAFENLLNRLVPTQSPLELVAGLLSSPKLLARAADGLLDETEQAAIRRPETRLADTAWTADDLPLLDEASYLLTGAGFGRQYRHLVVDEAQDLSPMQLRMLRRRTLGGMTILGDLAQATSPWAPRTWEDHLAGANLSVDHREELVTGYRTVEPIVEFSNRLLPTINVDAPEVEALLRDGDEPVVSQEPDLESMVRTAVDFAGTVTDREPEARVGIIAEQAELDAAAATLRRLSRTDQALDWAFADDRLTSPVTLVAPDDVKGLEFDHVIVLEPSKLYDRDPVTGPRLLYVAMTRARQGLSLVHTQRLPAVLRRDPSTPQKWPEASQPVPTTPVAPAPSVAPPPEARQAVAGTAGGVTLSWSHVVGTPRGSVLVRVAGHIASVELLPDGTGSPRPLATGHLVQAGGTLAWALQTPHGAVAVTTPADPAEAAHHVVARSMPG